MPDLPELRLRQLQLLEVVLLHPPGLRRGAARRSGTAGFLSPPARPLRSFSTMQNLVRAATDRELGQMDVAVPVRVQLQAGNLELLVGEVVALVHHHLLRRAAAGSGHGAACRRTR